MVVGICQECGAKVILYKSEKHEYYKSCPNCGTLVQDYRLIHPLKPLSNHNQTMKLLTKLQVDFDSDNKQLFHHLFYWKEESTNEYSLYYKEWYTYLGNMAPYFDLDGSIDALDEIDFYDYFKDKNQQYYYSDKDIDAILEFDCIYKDNNPNDHLCIPIQFPIETFVVMDFHHTDHISYLKDNQLVMRISNKKENWEKHHNIINAKVEEVIANREYEEYSKFREEVEKAKEAIRVRNLKRDAEKVAMEELIESGEISPRASRPPIPREIVDAIWRRDGGKCVYCGSTENLQIDHIIPFSKGGATCIENLQILCQKCNAKKSNNIG